MIGKLWRQAAVWGNDKNVKHDITIISNNSEVVGDLKVKGELHLDGKITGNILAEDDSAAVVKISDKGIIEGEIKAPKVIVNGTVKGDIYSSEHIELAQKANVEGDVHYKMMEMVLGARVNGKLLHRDDAKPKKGLFSGKGNDKTVLSLPESQNNT
ncbi:bactofilin family protein [Gynuella sunshinyii]|uniref:bactofilin family protein n=1 Tax=Gynuella sunshinyii TaxID=1445505 RepID=UPI0009E5F06D|nr:polymer-forming cytoskeletal protein [Gynuella sunshinyii]